MKNIVKLLLVFALNSLMLGVDLSGQSLFFEPVLGKENSPNTSIHGITKDSLGYIWFGSWDGVYRYNGDDFDLFRNIADDPNTIPNNRIRNIITDQNKQVWLLTFDRKYVKYNYCLEHFETIKDSLVPNIVTSMLTSSPNLINRNSLINGKRILLSSNRLTERDIRTKTEYTYFANYQQPGGLADDQVTSFFIDDQQIIWLGTRNGEVYKANTNRKPFKLNYYYGDENHFKGVAVRVIQKVQHGLILGSNSNELFFLQNGTLNHKALGYNFNIRSVYSVEDDVLIGTTGGLFLYSLNSDKIEPVFDRVNFPDQVIWSVYAIAKANDENIWVGLYNGLFRYNFKEGKLQLYNLDSIINDHSVMDILVDSKQNVWLATEGNGIVRLRFDDNWNIVDTLLINSSNPEPGMKLSGNMVYSLYESPSADIWLATSDGLNRINNQTYQVSTYTESDGLANNYIAAILGDDFGNIWLSHKKGISKLEIANNRISNYSISDNKGHWSFMDGACYYDTTSQSIYFGAKQGLLSFYPDQIKANPFPPKIVLKKLFVNGEEQHPSVTNRSTILSLALSETAMIDLEFDQRSFSIEMAAIHYDRPENNEYIFQLEGYDDDWNQSTQRLASYIKVPPGEYVFKAKALTADNIYSDEERLTIVIHSPWYATKWAYVSYLVLVLFVLFLINREIILRERLKNQIKIERLKVENQEELNREKLEFFTNVSHELRTPLSLITDPIKQLQNGSLSNDRRKLYFSLVNKNIVQLTNLINQLLDFRKADIGKLSVIKSKCDLIQVIRESIDDFQNTAEERNMTLKFECNEQKLMANFDKDKLRQIIQNILTNAMKYTDNGGEIMVVTNASYSTINIIVEDNGVGIAEGSLVKIFEPFNNEGAAPLQGNTTGLGLALTKKLVELLNGSIRIESKVGKGTTVFLNFKIDQVEQVDSMNTDVQLSAPSILIVEDNRDLQDYLSSSLSEQFVVYQEYNGKSGFDSAIENIPNIIISDIMMPIMDGNEMCQKLKLNEKTCHIPIIMLTAKTAAEHKVQGLQTGADVYLTKPFNVDVLKAQVESILENRRVLENRLAGKAHVKELNEEVPTIDNQFLNNLVEIIKENIHNTSFSQQQLASNLSISQRQLYRKLKAISGSTVHEFITRVRMDEAVNLLIETTLNVSEIAYKVGFSESSNFSRTFSKHFGVSPSKYRKR